LFVFSWALGSQAIRLETLPTTARFQTNVWKHQQLTGDWKHRKPLKTHTKLLQVIAIRGVIALVVCLLLAAAQEPKPPIVLVETLHFSRACPTDWEYEERTQSTVSFKCQYYEEDDPR
jgi:hypothetical protein